MSGGSYDYGCFTFENNYVGRMFDPELNKLVVDLAKLLHDLEWWQSCDISEEAYRNTVEQFKKKWLRKNSDENLKLIILEEIEKLKSELLTMLAGDYKEK